MKEQAFWKNYFYHVFQLRAGDEASGLPSFPAPPTALAHSGRADSVGSNRSVSSGVRSDTTTNSQSTGAQPSTYVSTATTTQTSHVTATTTTQVTASTKTMSDAERKAAAARASHPVRPVVKQPRSFALEDDGDVDVDVEFASDTYASHHDGMRYVLHTVLQSCLDSVRAELHSQLGLVSNSESQSAQVMVNITCA